MCQDATLHKKYFDKKRKGKLILSNNSSTLNQSKPKVNSWVLLNAEYYLFLSGQPLKVAILITELFCNTSGTNLAGIPTKVLPSNLPYLILNSCE